MTMEAILQFIFKHNDFIIEILIGLTLLLIVGFAFKLFFFPGAEESTPAGVSPGLEASLQDTLQKLLEKAGTVTQLTQSGEVDTTTLTTQIEDLRKEIEKKNEELKALAAAGGSVLAEGSVAETEAELNKFRAQILDLENKLAEYEIISEDIADLSKYKEQNASLKKELDEIKTNMGRTPPPLNPQAVLTPEAPAAEPQPATEAEVAANANSNPITDDIMAEFANAMAEQKNVGTKSELAPPPPPPPPIEEPAAEQAGDLDLEKMSQEAVEIQSVPVDANTVNPIEQTTDEDKLVSEASALTAPDGENAQLMDQFEQFMKGKKA